MDRNRHAVLRGAVITLNSGLGMAWRRRIGPGVRQVEEQISLLFSPLFSSRLALPALSCYCAWCLLGFDPFG